MKDMHRLRGVLVARRSGRLLVVALALACGLHTPVAHAATWWWSGTGLTLWSTASNWSSAAVGGTAAGTAPGASDDAIFNITANNSLTGTVGASSASINSITVNNSGTTYLVRSSTASGTQYLSVGAGGLTMAAGSGPVIVNGTSIVDRKLGLRATATTLPITNNSSSLLTIERGIDNTGITSGTTTAITIAGNGTGGVSIVGNGQAPLVSSTMSLTVNMPNGAVLLDAASAYVGDTTLTAGVLGLGSSTALGTGRVFINGGAIASKTSSRNLANNISVGGNFTAGGNGAGALTWTSAGLTLSGSVDLTGGARTITLGNSLTISGTVTSGTLIVAASGTGKTLTLSGSNSYSGGTTVDSSFSGVGNTLAVGHVNALGTGPLVVNAGTVDTGTTGVSVGLLSGSSGATITTNTTSSVTFTTNGATDSTYAGAITNGSGTLALAKNGAGTLTLSGSSNFSGGTTINAGGITAGNANALGSGAVTLSASTTLGVTSGTLSIGALNVNSGTISLAGLTNGIASTGALNFTGVGNTIAVGGSPLSGTSTLVSGASTTSTSGLSLTGAAVGNATISLSGSQTVGRNTYEFKSVGNSLQLVTTANVFNLTWDPSVSSGTWNTTATNWVVGGTGSVVAFGDGDNVTFGSTATVSVPSNVAPGTMTITNASGTVDLSGAGSIAASTLAKSGAGGATIATNLTVASGVTVSGGSLATNGTLGVTAGGITVNGGDLTTGSTTTVTAGGLNVSGGSFTGNAATTVSAGGLNVSGGLATLNAASTIAGGVAVTGGTAALNAANTISSGSVAVSNGGTLSLGDVGGAGSGSISLNNGTLASTLASGTLANAIALGSGGGTVSGANPLTLTGAITGPGTLTKTGAGELVVSGSLGTSTTGVAVSVAAGSALRLTGAPAKWLSTTATGTVDGTLTLDNAAILLKGGTVSVGSGSIVLVGANTITGTTSGPSTIATTITGTGSLSFGASPSGNNGNSTYVILSGSNSYTGGTTLNQNVGMANNSSFGTGPITATRTDSASRINNVSGGVLTLANNISTGAGNVFSITGAYAIQLTGTITGSGLIRSSGGGTIDLTLQTAATMQNTGSVDIGSSGVVLVSSTANLGSLTSILVSGTPTSTLRAMGDTGAITQPVFIGATNNNPSTFTVDTNGYAVTLAGVIQNLNSGTTGGLVKTGAGTLTLTASNTYTRDTLVSAGTLLVNGALYTGTAAGTTTVASGAVLGGSGLIAGAVNVNGTLKGNGTQFTGPVTVLGGTHAPGNSPGLQTFLNDLTYSGSSTLEWELIINGTTGAGTNFDFITLTGGTLSISDGADLAMVFNGAGSSVNWNDTFWNSNHSWTVIDASGALASSGIFGLLGTPATWLDFNSLSLADAMAPNNRTTSIFQLDNSTGSIVLNYVVASVPEPTTMALAAGGLTAMAAFGISRRRRR